MPFVVRESIPDDRAEGRLRGEEAVDFREPTECSRIPGIQCHREIIQVGVRAIPEQGCAKLSEGLRLEARERLGEGLGRDTEHPAQTDQVPSVQVGVPSTKPQGHRLTTDANPSSKLRLRPTPRLQERLQRSNIHDVGRLPPERCFVKST